MNQIKCIFVNVELINIFEAPFSWQNQDFRLKIGTDMQVLPILAVFIAVK